MSGQRELKARASYNRCFLMFADTRLGQTEASGTNDLPVVTRLDAVQHNEMRHYATPDSYEFVYVRIL